MTTTTSSAALDGRDDRRAFLLASGTVALTFALGVSVQTAYVYAQLLEHPPRVSVWARIAANLLGVLALLALLALLVALGVHRRQPRRVVAVTVVLGAAGCAALRIGAQRVIGVYHDPDLGTVLTELLSAFGVGVIAAGVGLFSASGRRRIRDQTRQAERSRAQIEMALQALQHEEVRVRREVAEGLHGSLQQRLVLVAARLDRILEHVRAGTSGAADVDSLAGCAGRSRSCGRATSAT